MINDSITNRITYIKKQLQLNKGTETEIDRNELIDIVRSYGIKVPDKATKKEIVQILFKSEYVETFIRTYEKRFYVPAFTLAKHFNLSTYQINKLSDAGVIHTFYELKECISNHKGSFQSRFYECRTLDIYNQEHLLNELSKLENFDINIRLEVNDKELVDSTITQLKKVFPSVSEPTVFPASRDNKKLYVYIHAKLKEEDIL